MTAKDFYRILSRVQGMQWMIVMKSKPGFGIPADGAFIRGTRHTLYYSPASAVASCVRRRFVDRSDKLNRILRLNPGTFRRIQQATHQDKGFSLAVRRKLLAACHISR